MKRSLLTIITLFALTPALFAQEVPTQEVPEGFTLVDSLVIVEVPRYNEELEGKTIYQVLPEDVTVHETTRVKGAVRSQVEANRKSAVNGYRIRIYFDNKQNSREASAAAKQRFESLFPGYKTYLGYENPFFKVTVGDFRTKVDAQLALAEIQRHFPSAFIVKEKMRFPVINEDSRIRVDTLKVLVPIE